MRNSIGVRIPAGAPKNLLAFWRGDFFWSLPGSRSLSPSGEIPAGAPKNIPRLLAGDIFFRSLPGSRSLSPSGEIPAGAPKRIPCLSARDSFFGRSRGVEVYPRQGKSPLYHQKESLAFRRGILFSVAPGESKFIPVRGNPRWSTKIEKTSNPLRLLVFLYLSMLCGAFGKLFGAKNVTDLRLFSA